jgi:hypothetical protein
VRKERNRIVDEKKDPVPWYRQPVGLGLLGVALAVAGSMLTSYTPLNPRQQDQERQLSDVRRLADPELDQRLEQYARHAKPEPPYRLQGRLIFFAGVVLFVLAAILMFRAPPAEPANTSDETDGAANEADGFPEASERE